MASISPRCIIEQPLSTQRTSKSRSIKQNPAHFGMHQPQAEPSNNNCFQACFSWIKNFFRREPSLTVPLSSSNLPLLDRTDGISDSALPERTPQPSSQATYGSFQLPSSDSTHHPSLSSHPAAINSSNRSSNIDHFVPKPNRVLKSVSGKTIVPALEEGHLDDTGMITLKDASDRLLGSVKRIKPVVISGQEFHRLQVLLDPLPQSTLIDQACVMKQLIKTTVQHAKSRGMALMVHPQDGEQEFLYRQHGFRPLEHLLGEELDAKYKSYLAVNFPPPYMHEHNLQDSDQLEVGPPPGWKEQRRLLQRLWEDSQGRQALLTEARETGGKP